VTRRLAFAGALAFAAVVSALPAAAAGDMQHPDRLRGRMFIAGATLVDPPDDEPRRSHAYVEIIGEAARHLFEAMATPAVPDQCEPGRKLKRVANLVCSIGALEQDARCDFAIDLRSGELAVGTVC
jgi:hypothetical protein